ncbi:MAG TPA: hypothetical protein VJW76_16180 [Verrucomicrobiae bacterium]|nr:hypothetical protein [Verrucomicrobiae bacterium]
MRKKIVFVGLVTIIALWGIVTTVYHLGKSQGYQEGYARGFQDQRRCWKVDPASTHQWTHGTVTARRDMARHPFLRAVPVYAPTRGQVNSIPARLPPR